MSPQFNHADRKLTTAAVMLPVGIGFPPSLRIAIRPHPSSKNQTRD